MNKIFILAVLPCALGVKSVHASALLKPTSGVTQALTPKSLQIESNLRGAFAQTTVTTTYANPSSSRIEADFMYSAPKGSVVTGFAYWYGQEKVVARVVEKGRAAQIYQYITTRMRDPALIEMVGPNKFRARIFPVEANTDLKIEVKLAQTLGASKDGQLWSWPMKEETRGGALQSVSVHLKSDRAFRSNLGSVKDNELSFQRTNFRATVNANALVPQNAAPLRASLVAARDGGSDGFFALVLTSNSPVALPRLNISGVSTYSVLVPTVRRLDASGNFVVMGRYRGSGMALVSLNGRSVQVKFPATRETNNLPSLLWASGRIESLSGKDSNKSEVMALSKRFGVPSRWTSWLAIPEEERKNFRRQILMSDRDTAGRAYAQAISRGDRAEMGVQKALFTRISEQLKAEGYGYNVENTVPASYLDSELSALRQAQRKAKSDGKISLKQRGQWAVWAKNLQKAGASENNASIIEDELRDASRMYLLEIEAGRRNGQTARTSRARLQKLAQSRTARQYGWNENSFLTELAEERADTLATEIAAIRASERPNRGRQKQLEQKLARLGSADVADTQSALDSALEEVWGLKISPVVQQWADEIAAGRADGTAAAKYRRQVRALEVRSGVKDIAEVDAVWEQLAAQTAGRLADSIRVQGPKGEAARSLDAQIKVIAVQSKYPAKELHTRAWQQVMVSGVTLLNTKIRGGEADAAEATTLQRQLAALGDAHDFKTDSRAQESWVSLVNNVSKKLTEEVQASREDGPKARALQSQLDLAKKYANVVPSDYQLKYAWDKRARAVAKQAIEQIATEGQETPQSQQLQTKAKEYAAKGVYKADYVISSEASAKIAEIRARISAEIAAKHENGPQIGVLRDQEKVVRKVFPGTDSYQGGWYSSLGSTSEEFAWEGRAHEAAYQLLQMQKSDPTNTARLDSLQNELNQSVDSAGKDADAVLAWEKMRLANNEPLITASDYRLRSGDPLISVMAPATCQQVVAQMPDGTLLPLHFNALNKAWEARFDVPTFASDGDYRVKILIVAPDGARRQLTMNFAVDSRAPQGTGTVSSQGKVWHLRLQSDQHTDRVSAFLPWNERVELRRDENAVFVADVPVPAEFKGAKAQVRFLLTDGAHNKTEVLVDLNH